MRMIPPPLGVGSDGKYSDLEAVVSQFNQSADYDFSFAQTLLGLVANAIRVDHDTGLTEGESYRCKEVLYRALYRRREWKATVKLGLKLKALLLRVSTALITHRLRVRYNLELRGLW